VVKNAKHAWQTANGALARRAAQVGGGRDCATLIGWRSELETRRRHHGTSANPQKNAAHAPRKNNASRAPSCLHCHSPHCNAHCHCAPLCLFSPETFCIAAGIFILHSHLSSAAQTHLFICLELNGNVTCLSARASFLSALCSNNTGRRRKAFLAFLLASSALLPLTATLSVRLVITNSDATRLLFIYAAWHLQAK